MPLPFGLGTTQTPNTSSTSSLPFGMVSNPTPTPTPQQHIIPAMAAAATNWVNPTAPAPSPALGQAYKNARIAAIPQTSIGQLNPNNLAKPDLSTVSRRLSAPIETLPWYQQPGRAVNDAIVNQSKDVQARFQSFSDTMADPNATTVDKASKGVSLATGVIINSAFLPFTAAFQGSAKLPVIGNAIDMVNQAIGKVGEVGSVTTKAGIDSMVTHGLINQKTANSIYAPAEELGGLLTQVFLGKVGHDVVSVKLDDLHKAVIDNIKNDPNIKNAIGIKKQLTVTSETPNATGIIIRGKTPQPVVTIKDVSTGDLTFQRFPKEQLPDFINKIDETSQGIAGKEIDGKIYHLTAKSPESLLASGAIDGGAADINAIPKGGSNLISESVPAAKETFTPKASLDIQAKLVAD